MTRPSVDIKLTKAQLAKPRLYISGPITGLPDHNKAAFEQAWEQLVGAGYTAVNPHVICAVLAEHECAYPCTPSELELPWADYLRSDLIEMLRSCEALAMLPGWETSRGARLEVHVARDLGWEVKPLSDWLDPC